MTFRLLWIRLYTCVNSVYYSKNAKMIKMGKRYIQPVDNPVYNPTLMWITFIVLIHYVENVNKSSDFNCLYTYL